jgi:hypothetical protein
VGMATKQTRARARQEARPGLLGEDDRARVPSPTSSVLSPSTESPPPEPRQVQLTCLHRVQLLRALLLMPLLRNRKRQSVVQRYTAHSGLTAAITSGTTATTITTKARSPRAQNILVSCQAWWLGRACARGNSPEAGREQVAGITADPKSSAVVAILGTSCATSRQCTHKTGLPPSLSPHVHAPSTASSRAERAQQQQTSL